MVGAALLEADGRAAPRLVLSCDAFPPTASLVTLRRELAAPEAVTDSVPLGSVEGEMVAATVLFPADRRRRVEIVWKDSAAQSRPRFVRLAAGPTEWRTADGITIGTPLRELEHLNGRAFRLAGFGFDGSGAVISWNGGRLASPASTACQRRVYVDSLTASASQSKSYRTVRGDREFSSSIRAMQKLNPRISSLLLEYP
jgi:hypothetical protein